MQNRYEPDLLNEAVDSIGYSLFVFDKKRQTIWRFNRDGRFLNKTFRQGTGLGEYANIEQFEYNAYSQKEMSYIG